MSADLISSGRLVLAMLMASSGCTNTGIIFMGPDGSPDAQLPADAGSDTGSDGGARGEDATRPMDAGETDGGLGLDAGPECVPGEMHVLCAGDELITCDETGRVEARETCALGCDDARFDGPACRVLDPAILPARFCYPGLDEDADFGTTTVSTASSCTEVLSQSDGSELCIVDAGNIHVLPGAVITATGGRVLVLLAHEDFFIEGTIDVSADFVVAGSGSRPVTDPGAGGAAAVSVAGGGGGGHGTAGGAGSTGSVGSGGAGGAVSMDTVAPLRGGAPGGAATSGAPGGAGGGAVALISCGTLRLGPTAVLDAGGGGGIAGVNGASPTGGSGGGSAGTIYLEGVSIDIAPGAIIAANGGGGGGGGGPAGTVSSIGADGTRSATPALGGMGASSGGTGGAVVAATAGGAGTTGGGGGGAAGVIRMIAAPGAPVDSTDAIVSPAPRLGTAVGE